jgi:NADP-dependent 3-hydroxy acid dehydrogenase YdfG
MFENKTALVTGASSGIGRATALELARHGCHVALAARSQPALSVLAGDIQAIGRQALVQRVDVTQQEQVEQAVRELLERWGQLDILVVNAGQYLRSPIREIELSILQRSFEVNFYGGIYPILASLPYMTARRTGHIVVISTADAKKALPPDAPYVVAKSALSGFVEVLRQELHGSGVYASTIFPGRVDTPMIGNLRVPSISSKISPEMVARSVIYAIRLRKPEVILPLNVRLYLYLNVFFPSLADWVARNFHLQGWETDHNP